VQSRIEHEEIRRKRIMLSGSEPRITPTPPGLS
jgi:hypothetical protein